MQLFPWKEIYKVGITEIDQQHRHLFSLINELSDAIIGQAGQEYVPQILEKLMDYIQLHFTTEEEFMRSENYPALDKQCQEHLELTGKVLELRKNYSENHDVSPSELLCFLCTWLDSHILSSDMEFAKFLKTLPSAKRQSNLT